VEQKDGRPREACNCLIKYRRPPPRMGSGPLSLVKRRSRVHGDGRGQSPARLRMFRARQLGRGISSWRFGQADHADLDARHHVLAQASGRSACSRHRRFDILAQVSEENSRAVLKHHAPAAAQRRGNWPMICAHRYLPNTSIWPSCGPPAGPQWRAEHGFAGARAADHPIISAALHQFKVQTSCTVWVPKRRANRARE